MNHSRPFFTLYWSVGGQVKATCTWNIEHVFLCQSILTYDYYQIDMVEFTTRPWILTLPKSSNDVFAYIIFSYPSEGTSQENNQKVLTLESAASTHGFK